jgi:hypothetical protein
MNNRKEAIKVLISETKKEYNKNIETFHKLKQLEKDLSSGNLTTMINTIAELDSKCPLVTSGNVDIFELRKKAVFMRNWVSRMLRVTEKNNSVLKYQLRDYCRRLNTLPQGADFDTWVKFS